MKEYLAYWYDYHTEVYRTIHANTLTEAKHKAFQMMCDSAGDHIYSVTVYEKKSVCECQGELNPHPLSCCSAYSGREYTTGRRI
jgi:hypothetical protein